MEMQKNLRIDSILNEFVLKRKKGKKELEIVRLEGENVAGVIFVSET